MWEQAESTAPLPDIVPVAGHWLVTSRALIKQILADTDNFSPANALDAVTPMSAATLRTLTKHRFRLPPTLANNATPSHPGLRALVGDALHPHRVEAQRLWLTGAIRRQIIQLAHRIRTGQSVDLYAGLARDVPLQVLSRLISLPNQDAKVTKDFSIAALELFWAPLSEQRQLTLAEHVGQHHAQLRAFVRTATGFVGALRDHAAAHGLGEDEVVAVLFFLLVAGQETTSQFLGLLLYRLISEQAVLDGLISGAVSPADVVEEGLRLEPPIVTWRRVANRQTTLAGVTIPSGASIVLCLAQAGRDGFSEPAKFCPGRSGGRSHLAFGIGAHRCLGAQLARMEAQVIVAESAPLLRSVRVVTPPSYSDNLSFRMPDALVVVRK